MKDVRVVVAHGAAAVRTRLTAALRADDDIDVVAECSSAGEAIDLIRAAGPDVVVLGLPLGDGGGLLVIEELMAASPVPILVLARERDSDDAVSALVAGAVDVLPEPPAGDSDAAARLRARVRIVAGVAVVRRGRRRSSPLPRRGSAAPHQDATGLSVVAIGASTGGPAALATVLAELGGLEAAVLVVQHLHADFVSGMVSWMDRVSPLDVEEAEHGASLRRGAVFIAPAGKHLRVGPNGAVVLDPTPETIHRPSVDVLFASLAERRGGRTIGVLLTGMGEDGAAGLLALRRRGHLTIAQDEKSSVVFGMPRAAQRLGAAVHVLPLDQIAKAILRAS